MDNTIISRDNPWLLAVMEVLGLKDVTLLNTLLQSAAAMASLAGGAASNSAGDVQVASEPAITLPGARVLFALDAETAPLVLHHAVRWISRTLPTLSCWSCC